VKVLAVVPNSFDRVPAQRFRIEQWEPWLRKFGAEIDYAPFESAELNEIIHRPGNYAQKAGRVLGGLFRRFQLATRLKQYDLIYLFRESALVGPAWFERWARLLRCPVVYDFDDAVWVAAPSLANGWLSALKMPGKTRTSCRLATHVMAGNPYLAEYAAKVNSKTTVVPTTIELEKYSLASRNGAAVPVIGWSGSFSTVAYLDAVRNTLQALARTQKFQLRVIGAPDYKLPGVDVISLPWVAWTEVEDLRPIDIGLMPLIDDEFSRGKCGLKALQYMALGIPPVVSPVGVNTQIIQDGVNGFLASTPEEWIAKITLLLRDPELRRRMGSAARATVEGKYSAAIQSRVVFDIFNAARLARRQKA
jgi:glycosyltransferase involved in cell wall biosynthesis